MAAAAAARAVAGPGSDRLVSERGRDQPRRRAHLRRQPQEPARPQSAGLPARASPSYRASPTPAARPTNISSSSKRPGCCNSPLPDAGRAGARPRCQVAENIGLPDAAERAAADGADGAGSAPRIKHVVFIIKENRTYDQVLGDLEVGNGDPHLAILGAPLSPNHHRLARQFVTLDNFYDSGEQSSTGWTWSTAGRAPDLLEKTAPVNYADRGLAYEAEENDRNIHDRSRSPAERHATDPTLVGRSRPAARPGAADRARPATMTTSPARAFCGTPRSAPA